MRPALVACVVLLGACASAPSLRVDPLTLPICTQWADSNGSITIPPTCRYQVAPGEWLVVRQPEPKKARPWWLLALLIL